MLAAEKYPRPHYYQFDCKKDRAVLILMSSFFFFITKAIETVEAKYHQAGFSTVMKKAAQHILMMEKLTQNGVDKVKIVNDNVHYGLAVSGVTDV